MAGYFASFYLANQILPIINALKFTLYFEL